MPDAMPLAPRDEQDRRIAVSLKRQLGDFAQYVGAPGVTDMMLNPDGHVWVHRAGQGKQMVGRMAPTAAEAFIGTVASTVRGAVTRDNPILECELPAEPPFHGARIEALIRPLVSSPTFAIRFKATLIYTPDDYVRDRIMTPAQRWVLRDAVERRRNILVSGGTGAGKSTLLNSVIWDCSDASPKHRFVVMEDTTELQCHAADVVIIRTSSAVSLQASLKATMRLQPDRIIVGEVRGGEALALLKAWNTGHDGGASTLHANDARSALTRLENMIQEVSMAPQRQQIAEAINLIIHIAKVAETPGRRVQEIVAVRGYVDGQYQFETVG